MRGTVPAASTSFHAATGKGKYEDDNSDSGSNGDDEDGQRADSSPSSRTVIS
jgi:hypothetical protein